MKYQQPKIQYWYGNAPKHWEYSKIGVLYSLCNEKVSDVDYEPLSVGKMGVVSQLEDVAKTNAHDDRKKVSKGDFVINSRSDRRNACGISEKDGSVSLINIVLKPKTDMIPNYYNWLYHTDEFADEFYKWGHGIVDDLWTTNYQDMKNIIVPRPSLEEQEKIAKFLDEKCATVDNLHNEITEQIELLKKYKQRLITKVIVNGLDTHVESKFTGIKWIKKIPKNWKLKKIKYFANIFGRIGFRGYKEEDLVDEGEGAITLSPSNLVNGLLNFDKCTYISWDKYYESPEIMLQKDDIVFVKTGSSYGKASIVDKLPCEVTINPQLAIFKDCSENIKFFYYFVQSNIFKYQVENIVVGGTIPTMSQEKISNFICLIPPLEEQQEIADYLDDKCSKIDNIIKDKQEQLKLLEDYKKSLIYEYVTGKKEIKD